jgi:hypothetical protein
VGERCQRDEAGARPVDEARASQRHRFDDPGVGPLHAPQVEVDGELDDF